MMLGLTGTPGTGKTSISLELEKRGYRVVHAFDTVRDFIIEHDPIRETFVVDIEQWVLGFPRVDAIVEGHLAHFLPCDRVIVLRCRPDILRLRLNSRQYREEKIRENLEAEALDVILIETLEEHPDSHIFELDTTALSVSDSADRIEDFIDGKLPPTHGAIDWSEYLVLNA